MDYTDGFQMLDALTGNRNPLTELFTVNVKKSTEIDKPQNNSESQKHAMAFVKCIHTRIELIQLHDLSCRKELTPPSPPPGAYRYCRGGTHRTP